MVQKTHPAVNFISTVLLVMTIGLFFYLAKENETITVESMVLNVRTGPSLNFDIQEQVKQGEQLIVLNKKNNWYRVLLPNKEVGWVASWLVKSNRSNTKTNLPGTIIHETQVYTDPRTSSDVLKKIKSETKVIITREQKDWLNVVVDNVEGWVLKDKVALNNNDDPAVDYMNTPTLYTAQYAVPLRDQPSIKGTEIELIYDLATPLNFISEENGWYYVEDTHGIKGYVANWLVSFEPPEKNTLSAISEASILIDAGHGGEDPGAHSEKYQLLEKDVTLATALKLKEALQKTGAHVSLTRDKDTLLSLNKIVQESNDQHVDAFISLHFDSSDEPNTASGTTTYYYDKQGEQLAKAINPFIKEALPLNNRGVNFGDFYVLRENQQPAILLELGYINNDRDTQIIKNPEYQERIAEAITEGLIEYFSK